MRLLPASARRSFTLVELLVVMGIIGILAAMTLGVSGYAQRKAAANRAQSEIVTISMALEKYKNDNGVYPPTTIVLATTPTGYDGTVSPYTYTNNAAALFLALAGRTNLVSTNALVGPIYMELTSKQVTTNAIGTLDYVTDPFGYPYGYMADDPTVTGAQTNVYYNKGFFDLWSTRGQSGTGAQTNVDQWITNWKAY